MLRLLLAPVVSCVLAIAALPALGASFQFTGIDSRTVSAEAATFALGLPGPSDLQQDAGSGFAPFDGDVAASVLSGALSASASASQDSVLGGDLISLDLAGSASADAALASLFEIATGSGNAAFDVFFDLGAATRLSFTGSASLSELGQGQALVLFVLFDESDPGNPLIQTIVQTPGSQSLDTSLTVGPGSYRLLVTADSLVNAPGGFGASGAAASSVSLQVAASVPEPALPLFLVSAVGALLRRSAHQKGVME